MKKNADEIFMERLGLKSNPYTEENAEFLELSIREYTFSGSKKHSIPLDDNAGLAFKTDETTGRAYCNFVVND